MASRPERIGKYEITAVIGEGGMGAVYKATDPRIGRTVAIKVIKGDFADNPELLRRFYHEAQAVGNLQHPNIVVVHDLGEESGNPYLVMEYLNGTPLDKIIAQRQSVTLVKKLGIVIEVLNALHYAHQRNIVHRDVKPANVMVLQDDHIKLLDFGIARQGDMGQTKTNQLMGTMWYMSPEQLNGQIVDGRSDVFSTGILLFEVLAYALPFSTADMNYVVQRLRGDPPPPLSKYLQSYPVELDEIIARSLVLDREHRYSTAEEFAFDLARLQDRLKRDMVSDFVDQARESIARSDLTRARELLSEVLRVDTQNQTAKQLLYEIQQTLQKAARTERKNQLREQAASALSAKHIDSAENFLKEAIKLDATDPDLLSLREQIELTKSRAQQVKKLLTLAKVAQQTGELVVAKKAVDDALALDPQDTDAKLMQSAIARLLVEHERQRQIRQFLQAARTEIAAGQFSAAHENIAKAKAIDPAYPEIPGLEQRLTAAREQEARQRELTRLCSQIEEELNANRARAARDIAANAMRKFPGEPSIVRLKTAAEAAIDKEERRAYIEERITAASRIMEDGEANRALLLLKDVEKEYPTDPRLREYLEVVREAAARETAVREKQQLLQRARTAIRGKSFGEAIRLLEAGLAQFPEDSEVKDLLKTAREEFELLSKKKQVEDVSRQAQDLLQSRAHTDAIRLLERTAAQVSDPELLNLLQYARQEAAKFRAAVHDASEQATQMLNLGQHSEAVTFLEAQADKYGKNADFQVLLEQARKQAKETERARQRLLGNLQDARAKLRAHDIHGAEALLRACKAEAPDEVEILALEIEIEEEKKAAERRRAEADALAQEKAAAERREQLAAYQRDRKESPAPGALSAPSYDDGSATVLDDAGASPPSSLPTVMMPSDQGAAAAAAAGISEPAPLSATQAFGVSAAPAVDSAVLTPPPIEAPPPKPPETKKEPKRKGKGRGIEPEPGAIETIITPIPEEPLESTPLAMQTVIEEPKPVALPPLPPKPPKVAPAPTEPVPPIPPRNKRPLFIAGGGLAVVVLAVVIWLLIPKPPKPKVTETPTPSVATKIGGSEATHPPTPTTAILKIIGAPPGAKYRLGEASGEIGPDGTAEVQTKPGQYTLEVDAPDYKHYSSAPLQLELGNNEPLTVSMLPLHAEKVGTLIVKANVDHFEVFVNGQVKSNSGRSQQVKIENLPEGSLKVLIKKTGFEEPKEQSVKVAAKKEQTVVFTLKPPAPTEVFLSVTVRPSGARIRIDDGAPIPVPDGSYNGKLSPGNHKIEASADGYQTLTRNVTAKAGETLSPPPFELQPIVVAKPEPTITASASSYDIEQGNSATIRWTTQNAAQVMLDGKPVDANGQKDVTPEKETTYTLIAKGPGGEKTERIKITVHPKPATIVEKPPAQDEKPGVQAAMRAWSSAYESKDDRRIVAAYPGIPARFKAQIEAIPTALTVSYNCGEPQITGTTAEMSCSESLTLAGLPPHNRNVKVRFAKRGDKWVVSDLVGSK